MKDHKDTIIEFMVPNNAIQINVKLSGFMRRIHYINVGDDGKQTLKFGSFHLTKCRNGDYIISLLGKNGEVIPNILCDIELSHSYFKNKFNFS